VAAVELIRFVHGDAVLDRRGEGFENKLAELLANKFGKGLSYSWYPQATGFVRNTLSAHKCDVIMGVPQDDDLVQVTNPYYRTAYALVFKQGHVPLLDDNDRAITEDSIPR
jgi:hypothetical protein